jgi:hypothetical protein
MPEVENSAAQGDGHGLRPVARSKLAENVLNMRLDCARGRAKAVADFLVAKTVGDMYQNFCLAGGQGDFREVFNQLLGARGYNASLPEQPELRARDPYERSP